jgi:hypothetical protein
VVWLVIISVLVLGKVLGVAVWRVVHPKKGLLLLVSISCNEGVNGSVLSFLDPKEFAGQLQRKWLRAKTDTKWRTDAMLLLLLVYSWAQVELTLSCKRSLSTSYALATYLLTSLDREPFWPSNLPPVSTNSSNLTYRVNFSLLFTFK